MVLKVRFVVLLVTAVLLAVPSPLLAQPTQQLTGTARSTDGETLPGASIQVRAGIVSRTAITGMGGQFSVRLPPGVYAVEASLDGFKLATGTVTIELGLDARLDITLEPEGDGVELQIETGAFIRDNQNLFADKDGATIVDFYNGVPERTRTVDNTLALREELEFDERLRAALVALNVRAPLGNQNQFYFSATGGLFLGDQELSFTNLGNQRTAISGSGTGVVAGGALQWVIARAGSAQQSVASSFRWHRFNTADASSSPAQSSSGIVTRDNYDITSKRTTFGLRYEYSAATFTWSAGVERYSNTYDLKRQLNIDFSSTLPGVTVQADGLTELSKDGWRASTYFTKKLAKRWTARGDFGIGKDSKRVAADIIWDFR